ncbi:MAG: hypothetical protein ABEJ92_06135 [Halobacteriales archaeon]
MARYRQPRSRSAGRDPDPAVYGRLAVLVAVCTATLTLAFVGVLALLSGDAGDVGGRFPYYVLGASLAFVGTLIVADGPRRDGREVLTAAGTVAAGTFVLLALGAEGLRYAASHPESVLVSRSGLYLLAAGFIGTGVGYWALRHWRHVASTLRVASSR